MTIEDPTYDIEVTVFGTSHGADKDTFDQGYAAGYNAAYRSQVMLHVAWALVAVGAWLWGYGT